MSTITFCDVLEDLLCKGRVSILIKSDWKSLQRIKVTSVDCKRNENSK